MQQQQLLVQAIASDIAATTLPAHSSLPVFLLLLLQPNHPASRPGKNKIAAIGQGRRRGHFFTCAVKRLKGKYGKLALF